jgi:hypothetical protein
MSKYYNKTDEIKINDVRQRLRVESKNYSLTPTYVQELCARADALIASLVLDVEDAYKKGMDDYAKEFGNSTDEYGCDDVENHIAECKAAGNHKKSIDDDYCDHCGHLVT